VPDDLILQINKQMTVQTCRPDLAGRASDFGKPIILPFFTGPVNCHPPAVWRKPHFFASARFSDGMHIHSPLRPWGVLCGKKRST
jgi:hypothetical protein